MLGTKDNEKTTQAKQLRFRQSGLDTIRIDITPHGKVKGIPHVQAQVDWSSVPVWHSSTCLGHRDHTYSSECWK